MEDPLKLKEEGNNFFKGGKFLDAINAYSRAIEVCPKDNQNDRAVLFKNRAACYLKMEDYKMAIHDSESALELTPGDTKALYRKCQALESLGRLEEAYNESRTLLQLDAKNTAVQGMCRRLTAALTKRSEEHSKTDHKVAQMFNLLNTKTEEDVEKKRQAAQNLIVLAREEAGAERIFRENRVPRIIQLAADPDHETSLSSLRALACLCTGHKTRAYAILKEITLETFLKFISMDEEELVNASVNILQQIILSLIGEDKRDPRGKDQAVVLDVTSELKALLFFVMKILNDKEMPAYGRDAIIDLLIKVLPEKDGIGKALTFVTNGGLNKVLHVACQVPELNRLPITPNTRMHSSVLLNVLYDEMTGDKKREYFRELCHKFLTEKFTHNMMESNMEAITAISALLQGPYDVGNDMLTREGVLEVMVAMAGSKDERLQVIATEAIIHSASKTKYCKGTLTAGVPTLKELYRDKNTSDRVRVRALVGLCKLGSYGGSDASIKTFAEGSTVRLVAEIRRFLVSAKKDLDVRKWAAEGMAYLTLDADVKEALCADQEALAAIIEVAKKADSSMYFGIVSVFDNLTCYDRDKPPQELVDLAKFAKQHVPEDHPKDAPEFVAQRVRALLKNGVVTALVTMSKTESKSVRELLSRTFLALVEDQENRGLVIAQGGAKACIPLANNNTDKGKILAAQALAKIAITNNPEIAFPGQRALEVVRPLIGLLHIDCSGLQNFESLMALTNLAQMSESVRKRIFKEKGVPAVEHYLYEEHEMIQRAAAECVCNLVMSEEIADTYLAENDKVKLLTVLSGEEDVGLVRGVTGALAMLSHHEIACKKIANVKSYLEILQQICLSESLEIQHRGLYIISNMIASDKDLATKLIESKLLEILMVLSKEESTEKAAIRNLAEKALEKATEYELIKPTNQ
ncbi:protein unc-45 homolog B-like [Ptychodera flava]|uniref:protein unc-45 homolog B-like n=1 Tax=Ptychodera flava TaxID=63121 RepID=UPI00396A3D5C